MKGEEHHGSGTNMATGDRNGNGCGSDRANMAGLMTTGRSGSIDGSKSGGSGVLT